MNKKGLSPYLVVVELVLIGFVLYLIGSVTQDFASQDYFANQAKIEDMGITIDTLYAAPGNLHITYQHTLEQQKFSMKDNFVEYGSLAAPYTAAWPQPEVTLVGSEVISFEKKGEELIVVEGSRQGSNLFSTRSCPDYTPESNRLQGSLSLNPLYGGANKGPLVFETNAASIASKMAHGVAVNVGKDCEVDCTRPLEGELSELAVVTDASRILHARGRDLVLSFDVGENPFSQDQPITIYYKSGTQFEEEATALSCALENRFKQDGITTVVHVAGLDTHTISKNEKLILLNEGDISLHFEVGNIYTSKSNILREPAHVAVAIARTLEDFYAN